MSECVVRMEMPHDGLCDLEQTLIYGLSTYCAVNGGRCNYSDTGTRPDYCPIVCSLPEGHGRLVDAELVKEILKPVDSISHYEPEWTWGELHESNCVAIDNAPTIVPAEAQRKVNASDAVAPTDTPTDTPTVPAERSDT